jgi:hypothetical protein
MRPGARFIALRVQLLVLLLLSGIGHTASLSAAPAPAHQASPIPPVEQHKTLRTVLLTLTADRPSMGLTDTLTLTLTVEAPPEVRVTLPEVTTKTLGPFEVIQQRTTGPLSLTPQTQQWQRQYSLAVATRGSLTVPPLTVQIQEGDTTQSLTTDPFSITVTSLVPADADLSSPKDIAPPVPLVWRGLSPWVRRVAGGLAGVGLLAAGWWWYRRRQCAAAVPPGQRPAHVLALAALERLQRQDLIGQERVEEFYVRVSMILRRYIELRFGLRAPEQTTEEFLVSALATGGLIATHQDLLEAFLQHCDLVKFARHRPTPSAMEETFESAKTFVEHTADMHVLVAMPRSGEPVL